VGRSNVVGRGTRVTVTGRLDQRSWETDNGDKRSKVEIVADDIAISLRWATASVIKNAPRDSADGPAGGQAGRSFGAPAGGGQPQQQQPPAYQPDEEPF
jgi:single-strand DNA-binding protein